MKNDKKTVKTPTALELVKMTVRTNVKAGRAEAASKLG